jgi:low temperature requirement protein LtrA
MATTRGSRGPITGRFRARPGAGGARRGGRAPNRFALYASGEGERHATWLELFFDLVFVLAIAELAGYLHDHLTVAGALGFVLLSLAVWLIWSNFSYHADLFDVDGPLYRVAMLAAMLLSIALAVSIPEAFDGRSAGFAGAYVALRVLLVGLWAWAWRRVEVARPVAARHLGGFLAGAVVWAASLLFPEPARYWVWGLGLLVEMATPVLAQLGVLAAPPIQRSHLPERFGLFTIIVLGESIVVTGLGVSDTAWATESVLVATLGFAVVACLWWLYFDHVLDAAAVQRAFTNGVRELLTGFAWAYGHLAIYIGLGAAAVGIELAIDGTAAATLEGGARSAISGGVALYLLAITALNPLSPRPVPWSASAARLGVALLIVGLAIVGGALSPTAFVGLLALALAGLTVLEVVRGGRTAGGPGPRRPASGEPGG